MGDAAHDRASLEWDLHRALERGELFLVYQPTFDLEDRSTNGVEALLRWKHSERGIISPARFVPIAEESGLIVRIGQWALRTACACAAEWAAEGIGVPVAVNVSVRQLERDGFVDDVRTALLSAGLPADQLTLEITETALMRDPVRTSDVLHTLKDLGVRLAIDDFGTGYSSMAYVQQFPVDAIKIDGSFVTAIASNVESSALLRTLVQLGKALGLETLAEGIEDEDQLEELRRQGCDSGQGFLYARPLLPQHLTGFLRQHAPLRSSS
jgi:EAL domain-containing protein (putative c-di-GMP-specific phosphodiesterase class I)